MQLPCTVKYTYSTSTRNIIYRNADGRFCEIEEISRMAFRGVLYINPAPLPPSPSGFGKRLPKPSFRCKLSEAPAYDRLEVLIVARCVRPTLASPPLLPEHGPLHRVQPWHLPTVSVSHACYLFSVLPPVPPTRFRELAGPTAGFCV